MKLLRSAMLAAVLASISVISATSGASAQTCEIDRPIVFGNLDWDSAVFHNSVARFILEKGYGCKTDAIPGSTIPLLGGVTRGDVDVVMEVWSNNQPDIWKKGLEEKKVSEVGVNFADAVQNWYVPRYLIEGKQAQAKDLRSVADLPKYKKLFKDQEEPSKGRFYNCIAGWICETVNTKKLHAYELEADYVNFRPGTGAALAAAIESALKRKQPILFYYWGPSWLLGKIGDQVVPLKEPNYNDATWRTLMETKDAAKVVKATAYPKVSVVIGVNATFAEKTPKIVEFLKAYKTTSALTSQALAYMQDNDGSAEKAGLNFLKTHQDVWTKWVPTDVAQRVKAALQ